MASAPPQLERYSAVARWLHWLIAAFVIFNIVTGIGHEGLPRPQAAVVIGLHMSTGVVILLLTLARLFWRLGHTPPPLPSWMSPAQRGLAHVTHWSLYVLMIALPVSGFIFTSAGPFPVRWYGLFELPRLGLTRHDPIVGISHEGHELLGWIMVALVVFHVAAALWHQFKVKDRLISRMW